MHWLAVSIVLSVLSQLSTQTLAVPVSRTSLQKISENSNHDDVKEEEEPFYAYVYEYDDEENQIWSDCSQDQSVMKIQEIELDPNPPQRGEPTTVSVKTKLYEQLDSGTISVLIKYKGIITVINKVFQICDLAAAVQKTCPIEEGKHEIAITDTFPSYTPSGTYVGVIIAKDSSGKQIACVNINITL